MWISVPRVSHHVEQQLYAADGSVLSTNESEMVITQNGGRRFDQEQAFKNVRLIRDCCMLCKLLIPF
jgi:hypothetical protein